MNYEELLLYLDIDTPDDFVYFEAMADLIECEDYIEQEALDALFSGADNEMTAQLIDEYFEEVMNGLPDDSAEIYTLLDQIKMCLEGLVTNAETEHDMRMFASELYRFRCWYSEESEVEVIPEDDSIGEIMCLRDAITCARMERLGGDSYRYSFENALNYEIDGYTMSLSELVNLTEDEGKE